MPWETSNFFSRVLGRIGAARSDRGTRKEDKWPPRIVERCEAKGKTPTSGNLLVVGGGTSIEETQGLWWFIRGLSKTLEGLSFGNGLWSSHNSLTLSIIFAFVCFRGTPSSS